MIIRPYCRVRSNFIHFLRRSGELQNHICGRSDIRAERPFLIPSIYYRHPDEKIEVRWARQNCAKLKRNIHIVPVETPNAAT